MTATLQDRLRTGGLDWEMVVRVRVRNAIEHDLPDAKAELTAAIHDEGGVWSVLVGWCEPEDMGLVSLEPILSSPTAQEGE